MPIRFDHTAKQPGLRPTSELRNWRGILQVVRYKNGKVIGRKWPAKRGKKQTAAQKFVSTQWRQAVAWSRDMIPAEAVAATELVHAKLFVPRDILILAMYGKLIDCTLIDGTRYRGYRIVAVEIQDALDTITTTPGALLVRTNIGWVGLLPAAEGKVLTTHGIGNIPSYEDPASPAGAGDFRRMWTDPYQRQLPAGSVSQTVLSQFNVPGGTLANVGDTIEIVVDWYIGSSSGITAGLLTWGTIGGVSLGGLSVSTNNLGCIGMYRIVKSAANEQRLYGYNIIFNAQSGGSIVIGDSFNHVSTSTFDDTVDQLIEWRGSDVTGTANAMGMNNMQVTLLAGGAVAQP